MDARLAVGVFLVVPADPTSSAHRRSGRAGPGTGARLREPPPRPVGGPAACVGATRPGRVRSEIRGTTGVVPTGHRGDLVSPPRRIRAGPTAPHRSLPPWRVRALRGAVGGGSRRDPYSGEVGSAAGGAPSEESQGARAGCGSAREPRRRSRSPGEGEVTGLGVLEAVRRTASSGWVPWSRCVQPGAVGARQGGGRGDPLARPGNGSPRALAGPVAVGKDRAGLLEDRGGRCGQPVG